MKLDIKHKKVLSLCMLSCLVSAALTGNAQVESINKSNYYAGVFGGVGARVSNDFHQLGTKYFLEADGGSLAVNAFGSAGSDTVGAKGSPEKFSI